MLNIGRFKRTWTKTEQMQARDPLEYSRIFQKLSRIIQNVRDLDMLNIGRFKRTWTKTEQMQVRDPLEFSRIFQNLPERQPSAFPPFWNVPANVFGGVFLRR
jgi:hypothetical protein